MSELYLTRLIPYIRLELFPRIKNDILPLYHRFLRSELSPTISITKSQVIDFQKCLDITSIIYSKKEYRELTVNITEQLDMMMMCNVFERIDNMFSLLEPLIGTSCIDTAAKRCILKRFENNRFIESLVGDF